MPEKNDRQEKDQPPEPNGENNVFVWACLCHFSALLGIIWWIPGISVWIPVGHLVGPLAVWLIKKGEHPFVNQSGKEALNFQVTMTIYGIMISSARLGLPGMVLLYALTLADVCLAVAAGVKASKGKEYRYPLVFWRLFK